MYPSRSRHFTRESYLVHLSLSKFSSLIVIEDVSSHQNACQWFDIVSDSEAYAISLMCYIKFIIQHISYRSDVINQFIH